MTLLVNVMTHTIFAQSICQFHLPLGILHFSERVNVPTNLSLHRQARSQSQFISQDYADMEYHAVTPPEYEAGRDSKRENLCQQDAERFNKTTPEAPSSGQLEAAGASSSGDPVSQKILQVTRY